jgi:putative protein-disulfide isomerase
MPQLLPTMLYVTDIYCGWCWGLSPHLSKFVAANEPRVRFSVISGGLFIGDRAAPIRAYTHIPAANKRIADLTGASFGDGYIRMLEDGSTVLDSADAAAAFAALREVAPERQIFWAHKLQEAFFEKGHSMSDPAVVERIAAAEGLDVDRVSGLLSSGTAATLAQADFQTSRQLGVTSYPTLLLIKGEAILPLPADSPRLDGLSSRLDELLLD